MNRKGAFPGFVVRHIRAVERSRMSRLSTLPAVSVNVATWRRKTESNTGGRIARVGLQLACSVLATLLLPFFVADSGMAAVVEVGNVGMTVGDLERELKFYTNTLPFELVSISEASGRAQEDLFARRRARLRVATLQLGAERITLTQHMDRRGKPIPPDSCSFDHWFQHVAIVVSDMDKAYERLRRNHVKHVSTSPQTLPAWNTNAGGITAFYFCDPEDHVLELIRFPRGKGDPKWQTVAGTGVFLGIDHTAIVVADTDASVAFYRDLLGMRVAGESENFGIEQEHLNQVFGARLRITSLRAGGGTGIELLEYIAPPGGRSLPSSAVSNDLIFWKTHLLVDDFGETMKRLQSAHVQFVSKPASNWKIVRDPDGHALEFEAITAGVASTATR